MGNVYQKKKQVNLNISEDTWKAYSRYCKLLGKFPSREVESFMKEEILKFKFLVEKFKLKKVVKKEND